jgi:peroxiredoxin
LDGFAAQRQALDGLGVKIVAASVDPIDKAREIAGAVGFPIGHGVTRDVARALGSWWEDRRQIIQPSEFVLDAEGRVAASSYSDGPLGRFDAEDVVRFVTFLESRRK